MTRAKRYEGMELHASRWHALQRDRPYKFLDEGMLVLREIIPNYYSSGYVVHGYPIYIPEQTCWVIRLYLCRGRDSGGTRSMEHPALLTHEEPYDHFPSDHLKTKLLLLAG